MKIQEKIGKSLGRLVDIALVTKPAANAAFGADAEWMRPVSHTVENSNKVFVRMPVGPFAIRVMGKNAVELLLHVSGKLVLRTKVESGLQYIRKDGSNNALVFGDAGEGNGLEVTDAQKIAALAATPADTDSDSPASTQAVLPLESDTANGDDFIQLPLLPDATPNSVFIVVRFVDDDTPGNKPPVQEYEVVFQMNAPADHDELVASRNLLTMVKPKPLINDEEGAEVSFEPPQTHRPTFTCTCTGCVRGGN